MEENTRLIEDEPIDTSRTTNVNLHAATYDINRQDTDQSNCVITDQPFTQTIDLELATLDVTAIKTNRNKAITSIVLAALASLACFTIFCTIPAIVFAILALRNKTKDPGSARSWLQTSLILMGVAWAMIGLALFLYLVLNSILFNSYY
ncbi:uncharacterized protein [Apostichopus japonicus]|uniref:uncharacterized protein isoform X2 n=1 Tax=Stichopus japonicus TaxID=307972 RepID=UPI003AB32603